MNPIGSTISEVAHRIAAVNGARLHYTVAGSAGTPVLLVHGFPETWWAFRALIPLLAVRHRVYAVDLRGFGDSSLADDHYSSAIAAEDLHALITHLSVGPMHVVGQDISGATVYRLAATHPESVLTLTAVESGLAGFGAERLADVARGGAWYIGALAAPNVAHILLEKQATAFIGDYLYPHYGVGAPVLGADDVAEFARTYGRPGGFSGAAGLYRAMLTEAEDLHTLARERPLRIPVAAVGTAGGAFTSEAFAPVTAHDVTAVSLTGVGHYVAQEAPGALAEVLLTAFTTA